ncbi:MAG: hypothetical protein ACO2PN_09790 [Pyrobaculum sp.]
MYRFKKYLDAIEFLRRVAEATERLNHHPAPLRKPNPEAHRPRRRQQDHREAPAAGGEIQKAVEESKDKLAQ